MKKLWTGIRKAWISLKEAWSDTQKRAAALRASLPRGMVCVYAQIASHRAEGFVNSAIKILIAVVIGALLLAGLYALFGNTILPTVTQRIKDMLNYAGWPAMMWDIRTAAFVLLLLASSLWDLRHREIPKGAVPGLFLAGLLCFEPIRMFGVLTGFPIFIVALAWKDRMGFGDVWLTVAAGFVVGFRHGLWTQIIAYGALLLFYLGCRISRKRKPDGKAPDQPYPLAPFLSLGFFAVYFYEHGGIFHEPF